MAMHVSAKSALNQGREECPGRGDALLGPELSSCVNGETKLLLLLDESIRPDFSALLSIDYQPCQSSCL